MALFSLFRFIKGDLQYGTNEAALPPRPNVASDAPVSQAG